MVDFEQGNAGWEMIRYNNPWNLNSFKIYAPVIYIETS